MVRGRTVWRSSHSVAYCSKVCRVGSIRSPRRRRSRGSSRIGRFDPFVELVGVEEKSLPSGLFPARDRPGRGQLVELVITKAEVGAGRLEIEPGRIWPRTLAYVHGEHFSDAVGDPFRKCV